MTISPAASPSLGRRLRAAREERGLSQRELAAKASISINAISLIERDENSPSVATLQSLANALNVKMSYFFDDSYQGDVILARRGERPGLASQGAHIETLHEHLHRQELEPFLVTLEPHAGSGERQVVHTGHEFVYCLEGQVEYLIDGVYHRVGAGDFLLFEAGLPHRWHNPNGERARFLLILQTPQAASGPVTQHFADYPSIRHIG